MAIDCRIIKIFTMIFDLQEDQIHIGLTQNDVVKWDSLAQMQLVVALENEFNIELKIDEVVTMISLRAIIDMLEKKSVL